MRALTAALVEAQLRKMELKFRHFEELETMLEQQQHKVRAGGVATGKACTRNKITQSHPTLIPAPCPFVLSPPDSRGAEEAAARTFRVYGT
jgi:hypothetical protein